MAIFSSLPFPVRHRPSPGRLWVILIHGMGATEKSWTDPCAETLAGGMLPFDFVLTDFNHPPNRLISTPLLQWKICNSAPLRLQPSPPTPIWEVMAGESFNLLAWSQRDSCGLIAQAVEELYQVMKLLPPKDEVVLLGHSRGGLIARRFLQDRPIGWERVRRVILLGSPNRGSQIAALAKVLSDAWFLDLMERFFPKSSSLFLSRAFAHVRAYLKIVAIAELAPDSPFMTEMVQGEKRECESRIPYINLIGTCTTFIRFYRIVQREPWQIAPVLSLLDGLETLVPRAFLPLEVRQGRGDGQVSLESACLPWVQSNHLFAVNHAQLLIDGRIQHQILQALREI